MGSEWFLWEAEGFFPCPSPPLGAVLPAPCSVGLGSLLTNHQTQCCLCHRPVQAEGTTGGTECLKLHN